MVELAVSTDSVRVYLKRIGKVALLNAEQEVALAKRIEAGPYAAERIRRTEDMAEKLSAQLRRDLCWIIRDDGPVLTDSIGWLTCRKTQNLDFSGAHTLFIVEIHQAPSTPTSHPTPHGIPHTDIHPLMQIIGNTLTITTPPQTVPYRN